MIAPLGTQLEAADVFTAPPVSNALAALSALNAESRIAEAQISRRKMRNRLIVANALAWIAIVVVAWRLFS